MTESDKNQIKKIVAGIVIAMINSTPSLNIKINKNESGLITENITPWIEVEEKGSSVLVSVDLIQISKRPPLYKIASAAFTVSHFETQARAFFKEFDSLKDLNFTFTYIGVDHLSRSE